MRTILWHVRIIPWTIRIIPRPLEIILTYCSNFLRIRITSPIWQSLSPAGILTNLRPICSFYRSYSQTSLNSVFRILQATWCLEYHTVIRHPVLSIRWTLAIDVVSFLHTSWSSAAFLSSARFIPDIMCISSIYLFLLPSPHVSIISFSILFARITWPQNVIFCFAALCLSDISPLARPISISIDSFVLFSVQETLSILLRIHISQT